MVLSLSACGSSPAAPKEEDFLGTYTAFAAEFNGMAVDISELDMESVLTLEADGKGYMTINDEGGDVTDWSVDGEKFSVTSGVSTIEGTIKDGIIKLDFDTVMCYYAKEGADTSSIELHSGDELAESLLSNSGEADAAAKDEEKADSGSEGLPAGFDPDIVSDDTHFVMELAGVRMVYEIDGESVTGLYGFIDVGSESMAQKTKENYKADDSVSSVNSYGSLVVITYNEKAYQHLSASSLEKAFADDKITE